jgi:hypothetical protein
MDQIVTRRYRVTVLTSLPRPAFGDTISCSSISARQGKDLSDIDGAAIKVRCVFGL